VQQLRAQFDLTLFAEHTVPQFFNVDFEVDRAVSAFLVTRRLPSGEPSPIEFESLFYLVNRLMRREDVRDVSPVERQEYNSFLVQLMEVLRRAVAGIFDNDLDNIDELSEHWERMGEMQSVLTVAQALEAAIDLFDADANAVLIAAVKLATTLVHGGNEDVQGALYTW
jgi:hypothetical protein